MDIRKKYDMKQPIPCWNWNGYNSQVVELYTHREDVVSEALELISAERERDHAVSVVILEDDEYISIVVTSGFEFYGWRESVTIFTNRPGDIVGDDYDGYTFIPA